ncbi:MAG: hypothetical protein LBR60_08170, partial [Fibrobacter sp.]|nr:hypothetical protein [Fibrobacter sp.]
ALAVAKEEGFEDGEIAGLIQGRAEGEIQGELKKAREMAKMLLSKGIELSIIVESSGLSEEEIAKL